MAYKKVGGLHFFSLGRFGLTFYVKKHRYSHITADAIGRAVKRKANLERLRGDYSYEVPHITPERFDGQASFNPYFER